MLSAVETQTEETLMTAYLISYGADPSDRLRAFQFPSRKAAIAAQSDPACYASVGPHSHAGGCTYVIESEEDVTFTGKLLVDVFNGLTYSGLKKFESRATGVKRLLAVLPTVAQPAPAAKETTVVTETQEKPKRASKASVGKPADAASFKAGRVRAGTARAKILSMMDGTKTAEEVGAAMGFEKPTYSLSHFYCLARDCGVGYSFDEAGRVSAIYPEGQSLQTAVAAPKE
jgi:hypothetical protein